jgi:glycosyltransferase involved in cell wall biosynthesis
MSDPLVTVVLPVRNGELFLAEAIESVLVQDYRPFELIVVDGGSTDRSTEIARAYDGVRCEEQVGQGLPNAWNQGVGAARGALIAFISSDDRWTPDKLSRQVGRMIREPELAYTNTMLRFFLEPGCNIPRGFNASLLGQDLVGRMPETLVAWRETFEAVGRFNERYAAAQDVDWFLRAQESDLPTAVVPSVLLHKRVHDSNLSSDTAVNTPALLQILRNSIQRRRGVATPDAVGPSGEEGGAQ